MARREEPGGTSRKDRQLAAQIRRALELTLAGDFEDEVLQNLSVESVEPAPGGRLAVTLTVHPPGNALPRDEVLARLEAARGHLLDEVARATSRRRLPELSFWVVAAPPP
jgi:ribosome-binding factor A